MHTGVMVETDVEIPLRDGTILRADVYRPVDGPSPTLLERTPYSKDLLVGTIFVLNPMRAAKAGYAVVVQDVRGRFRSDGDFYPFVNEAQDGFDTVEWAAAQPWSDGNVGMFGSSYMAAAQWQAAKARPPHLRTITPFQASADYRDGRSYRGGAFEVGSLLSIALYAFGSGDLSRRPPSERRVLWDEIKRALDDLPAAARHAYADRLAGTRLPEVIPYFFDWMDHDQPDDYWDQIDVTRHYEDIDLPVLHLSCWFDQFLVGTIRNYVGMRTRGGSPHARDNQHLFIGPWGHYAPRTAVLGTARIGDLDLGISAVSDLDSLLITWFDKWLKNKPSSRPIAPVRAFVTGVNRWDNLEEWPPASTETSLFLHGGSTTGAGRLASDPPGPEAPPSRFVFDPANPVPTCGGAHLVLESSFPQGAVDQRDIEQRPDVLLFTTDPLPRGLEVLGPVAVTLYVRSSAPCTDFHVALTDVHPDGRSLKVCDGVLRATLDEGTQPIVVELGDIGHGFLAGHRVRLHVTSSNFPRYDVNPNNGSRPGHGDPVVANQEVWHSPSARSSLRLPVRS
jgi:hypothetical protein